VIFGGIVYFYGLLALKGTPSFEYCVYTRMMTQKHRVGDPRPNKCSNILNK